MPSEAECPRCGGELRPPTLMHDDFVCELHGSVEPLYPAFLPDPEGLGQVGGWSQVPVWLPWPLPDTWVFTGLRTVGGRGRPVTAVVLGFTGSGLLSGPADLVIVSETPGTGLGARLAGLAHIDPDESFLDSSAATSVRTSGWPTPLWSLDTGDCTTYIGQAAGSWLWLIAWPPPTWSVIHNGLSLVDVRATPPSGELPAGALMPRLRGDR